MNNDPLFPVWRESLTRLVSLLCVLALFGHPSVSVALQGDGSATHADLELWTMLAEEGDADAQFNLGLALMDNSDDLEAGYQRAAHWFTRAAQQGHTGAQFRLGSLYINGFGVELDAVAAVKWWRQAAVNNHTLAQRNLAYAYYSGVGVARDVAQAKHWFSQAARSGDWYSIEMLRSFDGIPTAETETVTPSAETASKAVTPKTVESSDALMAELREPVDIDVDRVISLPRQEDMPTATPSAAMPTEADQASPELASVSGDAGSRSIETVSASGEIVPASSETASALGDVVPASSEVAASADLAAVSNETGATSVEATPQQTEVAPAPNEVAPAPLEAALTSVTEAEPYPEQGDSPVTDEGWLFAQQKGAYTIQLMSSKERQPVDDFVQRKKLTGTNRILPTLVKGQIWWYLIHGTYPTRELAVDALATLPIDSKQARIRSFFVLQKNRCQRLADASQSVFESIKSACAQWAERHQDG